MFHQRRLEEAGCCAQCTVPCAESRNRQRGSRKKEPTARYYRFFRGVQAQPLYVLYPLHPGKRASAYADSHAHVQIYPPYFWEFLYLRSKDTRMGIGESGFSFSLAARARWLSFCRIATLQALRYCYCTARHFDRIYGLGISITGSSSAFTS